MKHFGIIATALTIFIATQCSVASSPATPSTASNPTVLSTTRAVKKPLFVDVPANYWAYDSIKTISQYGLLSGYKNGTFKPDTPLTREECAALFSNILGDTPRVMLSSSFSDITSDRWSANAIEAVAQKNLMSGYSDNTYRPEEHMSRQEFAVVIDNYIHYLGYITEDPTALDNYAFSDQKFVAPWAQNAVRELAQLNILHYNPRNLFNPEKYITRAEAAEVTYRLLFTKESAALRATIIKQGTENSARKLLVTAFGENYDLRNKGAMFWKDGYLVIALKAEKDLKELGATLAFTTDKSLLHNVRITSGSYSLAEFDNLQTDAAYLYHKLEPQGTIIDVTPTDKVDALIFTIDSLSSNTQKAFNRAFGKKVILQTPKPEHLEPISKH